MLQLARWSARRRRVVLALWLVILAAGLGVRFGVGGRSSNDFRLPRSGSQQARDLLRAGFPAQAGDRDQIVFHARRGTLLDREIRTQIRELLLRISRLPHIVSVTGPYSGSSRSRDGTIGFATVVAERTSDRAETVTTKELIATAEAARTRALQVELGGPAIEQVQRTAVGSSMLIGLTAAVLVLLVSFGSLLAMGLPIVTALAGLGTGLGIIALVSRLVMMPDFSSELALMIGLGVGVDYALLIVTRYREAYRANGGRVEHAAGVALDSAGRAVVFAGVTVVISLLGMFALGVRFLYGPAIASAIAVLLVLAASLTLLPALLVGAGDRIGRSSVLTARLTRREPSGGAWDRWIRRIQRHPWRATAVAAAIMLALASPALGLRLGNTDAGNDPASQTTRRAYDLLARGFGKGFSGPLQLVARLPRRNDLAVLRQLSDAVQRTPDVAAVTAPQLSANGKVATFAAYPRSSPQSARTETLVTTLRRAVIPPLERATGATVFIGGFTAAQIDFAHLIAAKLWLFITAVVALSALLLLVVFRSFLIPLQAAVMNLLSIGASLGIVVAVFQWGWFGSMLGVAGGPIQAFLPVMVFAIVFGLSMDYEVFLVSRIHEAWVHGSTASVAIGLGLGRTARVVTAAAAVMVAVFASFVLSGDRTVALFGLGLATAVFLDAVVIRCVLLPAVLELLGRSTWAFPAALDRLLPRLAIEPADDPSLQTEPAAGPQPLAAIH